MDLFTQVNQDLQIETIDPAKDYYAELVGEDKPFKTNQALALAKATSDAFIKNLQRENKELRQVANEKITMQEFLDRVDKSAVKASGDGTVANQAPPNQPPINEQQLKTLSEEDIVRVLENRETAASYTKNLESVKDTLRSVWGENYQNVLQAKLDELGVSKKFLDDMAKTQPKAFLKLLDVESAARNRSEELSVFAPKAGTGINTSGNANKGTAGPKTHKDFAKIRDTNPREYFTSKVQNAMMAQATALGDAFYE